MRKYFILAVFILISLLGMAASVQAQQPSNPRRIGGIDITAYCARRNFNATLTNNNRDWACVSRETGEITVTLAESHFIQACREQYGNEPRFIAVQDGTDPIPAYRWGCIDSTVYTGDPLPIGFPPARLGGLDVGRYCNTVNANSTVVNGGNDWACTHRSDGATLFVLTTTDYNKACAGQYGNRFSITAVRDGKDTAVPAFNWSCYDNSKQTVFPTPSSGGRLGGLYVSGYCRVRGLNAEVTNNGADWACINPFTRRVELTLSGGDYTNLCRETYHATAYAVLEGGDAPASIRWACYEPAVAESFAYNSGQTTRSNDSYFGTVIGTLAARPGYEVNVRALPDLEATKLGRINAQGSYAVTGREAEWYRINYNGQIGYVAAIWVQVRFFGVVDQ